MVFRRLQRSAAAKAYARGRRIDPATPWAEARYAVVDLETTGLDHRGDEIVSFASVPIDSGRIVIGEVVTTLIRPNLMPDAKTIRIHGLRRADLAHAPQLPEVLDVIVQALTGRVLVAHAAWVEVGFLRAALRPAGVKPPELVIDTAELAARAGASATPDGRAISLADLVRVLGLPAHRPHTADGDALTTAQAFLSLAAKLDRAEEQTVGSLAAGG